MAAKVWTTYTYVVEDDPIRLFPVPPRRFIDDWVVPPEPPAVNPQRPLRIYRRPDGLRAGGCAQIRRGYVTYQYGIRRGPGTIR